MNETFSPGSARPTLVPSHVAVAPTRGGFGCSALTPTVRVGRTRRHKVRQRCAAADRGALWVLRHSR
ncbi:hypothetical protein [Kitasatospora sp. GAS1066B]|uniref:hypothetical protein n=1 Tax=Kitasatospora sp. GAS1066B TaxID=3156271 RepID=UPI003517BA92